MAINKVKLFFGQQRKIRKIIIVLFSFFFVPFLAKAVGISLNPASLEINYLLKPSAQLVLQNISAEPVIVEAVADDFKEDIKIEPVEVELMPQAYTEFTVTVDIGENFKEEIRKTNISLLTSVLDKKSFNAVSGVKVPLTIIIASNSNHWYDSFWVLVSLFALIIIILLVMLGVFLNYK